ncbi:MAG: hypothetical protein ACX930_03315 [Erythrobacter sp.]
MNSTLKTSALAAGVFALSASSIPANAQFGGLIRDATRGSQQSTDSENEDCRAASNTGRNVASSILGGMARRATRGLASFVPVEAFADVIVTEIACQLDEKEQEQAANATVEITEVTVDEDGKERKPEVGRSAQWTSETRENVSGTSTITAIEDSDGGEDCMTVTDVIIVEGEETRAEKRMCRLAGAARYTIVA